MPETARADDERVLGTQTIGRALSVLGVLRRASADIGVTEIARELSLHTSTAHRILKALVAEGYVAQNPKTDRYQLGREAFLLGKAAERNLGFDAVSPVLEEMQKATGESVNLVVRDDEHGLVVLRAESDQPLRFTQPVGARIPLYCTSTGKAMLAFSADPSGEVRRIGRLEPMTAATVTSPRALASQLKEIRERGYSVNRGERIPGVWGVAAPILDPVTHEAPAAIAVQGPAVRITEERVPELAGLVMEAAAQIAALLPRGYRI
jgi:IclR family acetate operon transcriptional repressor